MENQDRAAEASSRLAGSARSAARAAVLFSLVAVVAAALLPAETPPEPAAPPLAAPLPPDLLAQMGQLCITSDAACPLPAPAPIGSACICNGITGSVGQ